MKTLLPLQASKINPTTPAFRLGATGTTNSVPLAGDTNPGYQVWSNAAQLSEGLQACPMQSLRI